MGKNAKTLKVMTGDIHRLTRMNVAANGM